MKGLFGRAAPPHEERARALFMSKVVHAKPVWGWSLVLLSTLLLAPGASTSALHAALLLAAQARTAAAPASSSARLPAPAPPAGTPNAQTPDAARRADDEWTRRLRAQSSRPLTLLDLTGNAQPETLAVLVPARQVVFVPDEGDAPAGFAPSSAPRSRSAAFDAATPPRAPPAT